VGNKVLFTHWECDVCNTKFARTLDDHFAKHTMPGRLFAQTWGKKGVPSIAWGKSRIGFSPDNGFQIVVHPDDSGVRVDATNKQIVFEETLQPYIPRSVFKCLTKMALAIMPAPEIQYFTETIEWIGREPMDDLINIQSLVCLRWFAPGPRPLPYPSAVLGWRKDENATVPYSLFFIAFDNYAFQIHIPFCQRDGHLEAKDVQLVYFPDPFDGQQSFGPVRRDSINLSSNEVVRDQRWKCTLAFEGMTEERHWADKEAFLWHLGIFQPAAKIPVFFLVVGGHNTDFVVDT